MKCECRGRIGGVRRDEAQSLMGEGGLMGQRRGGVVRGMGREKFRSSTQDVPFELVCEIASAGAVAEASDVESGSAAARHVGADG